MLLQHQTVSRKTPGDGRLEISAETAQRVSALGEEFQLEAPAGSERATVHTMTCTCGKRGDGAHLHYFLESPVLKKLTPETDVRVELDGREMKVRVSEAEG